MALLCMGIVLVTALLGIFAPWVAPNDPYAKTSSTNSTALPGTIPWARIIWDAACSRACSSAYGPRFSFPC